MFYLYNTCKYFQFNFLAICFPQRIQMESLSRKDLRCHFITCSSQTLYNKLHYPCSQSDSEAEAAEGKATPTTNEQLGQ